MANNKVIFGNTTIMDISDSTVTTETLKKDEIAYNAAGQRIVGTMEGGGSSPITFSYINASGNPKNSSISQAMNISCVGYTNLYIGSRTISNTSPSKEFTVKGKNSSGTWVTLLDSTGTTSEEMNIDITNYNTLQFQAIIKQYSSATSTMTIRYNNVVIS